MENSSKAALRIGIQGVKASFHDVVARKLFAGRELDLVECATFRALCETLKSGHADLCLMAIENAIAGSIIPNYALLESYQFRVVGEAYLRIVMNLMALPGETLESIETVYSHPMAIAQCEEFLRAHPHMKAVASDDTAESAKWIAERKLARTGAIASERAAELYGLRILAPGIETNKRNYTRFLVLARRDEDRVLAGLDGATPGAARKATLRFELSHEPGSLSKILEIFARHGINLTKIQSIPLLGRPSEYSFHIDIEWDGGASGPHALEEIRGIALNFHDFGHYPPGESF